MKKSERERIEAEQHAALLASLQNASLPYPIAEFRFDLSRLWRFDYAWPDQKIALEVDGGLFTKGKHARGAGIIQDHEKRNEAAIYGWRVLVCSPVDRTNGKIINVLRQILKPLEKDHLA